MTPFNKLLHHLSGPYLEWEWWFVNLSKLKHQYYFSKLSQLNLTEIEELYNFFSQQPKLNSTDFYYIKSDKIYKSMEIKIDWYNIYFDVSKLKHKQNNEKVDLIYIFKEKRNENTYIFEVQYWTECSKTDIDHIVQKAFKKFKRQKEVDFYIYKDAKKFLTEQLNPYLCELLFNKWYAYEKVQTIREEALKVIDVIANFENKLVELWNAPKRIVNANYVVTLDRLPSEIITKIKNHNNFYLQIQERKELWFTNIENHKFLPIDTKYFKDIDFTFLEQSLDWILIKSENYQALIHLLSQYKWKIQTIYIDPPFNLNSSD